MYYIPRGGNRGGADQFTWEGVKTDKDREYYLGHSLKASVGRWQDGRDLQWFSKERKGGDTSLSDELKAVKEAEAEAMMAALGQKMPLKSSSSSAQYPPSTASMMLQVSSRTKAKQSKDAKKKHKDKRKKSMSKVKRRHDNSSSESASSDEEPSKHGRKKHRNAEVETTHSSKLPESRKRKHHHASVPWREAPPSRHRETDGRHKRKVDDNQTGERLTQRRSYEVSQDYSHAESPEHRIKDTTAHWRKSHKVDKHSSKHRDRSSKYR